jgi:hypothetical protein
VSKKSGVIMMPFSRQQGQPPGGGEPGGYAEATEALGARADALYQRLLDIERALGVQEWWMLGRVLPEARLLSEIHSLLAVARGELEGVRVQYFGRQRPAGDTAEHGTASEPGSAEDPAWVAASRNQAIGLLRMIASALPAMLQYAQMLRAYAERLNLAAGALDALSIVVERLHEVQEAIQQPPQ